MNINLANVSMTVTDVTDLAPGLLDAIEAMPHTIRVRLL